MDEIAMRELKSMLIDLTNNWQRSVEVLTMSIGGTDNPGEFDIRFIVKAKQ